MVCENIELTKLRVKFTSAPIADVSKETAKQMELFRKDLKPGMRVAVAAGSRGIANIALIVRAVVDALKAAGAEPFIVPAMGSHGGANAKGQSEVLATYGITPESMGAPVKSSMEVVRVSEANVRGIGNVPIYMDKHAYEADRIIVVNRVKAHTDFHGENESGIAKILVIGLGKHKQALETHAYLADGLRAFIPAAARAVVSTGKLLGALAIVEDGYDQTSVLKAVAPSDIISEDARLLKVSKGMMALLPFDKIDMLMVDWLGKNISGSGMDTNVIGRIGIRGEKDAKPDITTICLFGVTGESHGNATGVGLADLIPQSLKAQIDFKATYENACTSRFLCRAAVPITLPTDRDVVEMGLRCCGCDSMDKRRRVRIRDTLHIDEIYVSHALLEEIKGSEAIEAAESVRLCFNPDGSLVKL